MTGWVYLPGKGRCRILTYEGRGMFVILTNRDQRIQVHRDHKGLVFLPR